jgi:hypothetical protein
VQIVIRSIHWPEVADQVIDLSGALEFQIRMEDGTRFSASAADQVLELRVTDSLSSRMVIEPVASNSVRIYGK